MSVIRRLVIALAGVVALLAPLAVTAAPAQASNTKYGCPYGWVCLYPEGKSYHDHKPSQKWYAYRVYNLHGVTGSHWLYNNQWGDAWVIAYDGPNGTGSCFGYNSRGMSHWQWGPINSIRLSASKPARCTWSS